MTPITVNALIIPTPARAHRSCSALNLLTFSSSPARRKRSRNDSSVIDEFRIRELMRSSIGPKKTSRTAPKEVGVSSVSRERLSRTVTDRICGAIRSANPERRDRTNVLITSHRPDPRSNPRRMYRLLIQTPSFHSAKYRYEASGDKQSTKAQRRKA